MIKAINPNKSDYREDWFAEALGFALRRKEKMQFTIATISFPEPSQPLSFLHFVFLRLKKGKGLFLFGILRSFPKHQQSQYNGYYDD